MKNIIEQIGVANIEEIPNDFQTFSFMYKSDGINVVGFMMFPKSEGKHPVIFVNRGGTGEHGKITDENIKHYNFFAAAGYIAVFSQYRGSGGGEGIDRMGGDDVFDIINMHSIVSKIENADMSRIGMWGVSRGGMMAFQVIARVPWVKAMVAIAPIVDEVSMAEWRSGWREHQIETYGGSYAEQYRRSPIRWVKEIPQIPIMIIHGDKDDKTQCKKSIEIGGMLGATVTILPNEGHFIAGKTINQTLSFFQKNI